jgi:hypothetical protein
MAAARISRLHLPLLRKGEIMTGKRFQNRHIPPAAEEDSEDWTFLTPSQAVDAIAIDFTEYGPQPALFASIAPLVLGDRCSVTHKKGKAAVQILQDKTFLPVADKDLGFYLIHALETTPPDLETLAEICALVFQTRTRAGPLKTKNSFGIWVHSQMEAFVCSQCGECCRSLAYENNCTEADYHLWQSLGRRDILAWVQKVPCPGKKDRYQIWVDPDTGKTAETCPWLVPCPDDTNRFSCAIQEIKPRICRQYPYTKKHAVMTGCRHTWK